MVCIGLTADPGLPVCEAGSDVFPSEAFTASAELIVFLQSSHDHCSFGLGKESEKKAGLDVSSRPLGKGWACSTWLYPESPESPRKR